MILTRKGERRPAPASWGSAAHGAIPREYAPAPESRAHVRIEPEYGRGLAGLAAHCSLDAEG